MSLLLLKERLGEIPPMSACHSKILDVRRVLENKDVGYILGWWVAEGCFFGKSKMGVAFSLGKRDFERNWTEHLLCLIEEKSGRKPRRDKECLYKLSHRQLANLCREFGEYSNTKFIPTWINEVSAEWRKLFLLGYLRGDACIQRKMVSVRSTSKRLLIDVKRLIYDFGLTTGKVRIEYKGYPKVFPDGKTYNVSTLYGLNFSSKIIKFLEIGV